MILTSPQEDSAMKIWLMAISVLAVFGLTACDSGMDNDEREGSTLERNQDD
jgi:hypothetical protein